MKVCHILAAASWFGGTIALATLVYASSSARDSFELYGILNGARYVTVVAVVYLGGSATFFTGLAYSLCTRRGFFRYPWISAKWALTMGLIVGGAFLVGPRSTHMLDAADAMGIAALRTPGYVEMHTFVLILLGLELGMQALAVILSVYRPGECRDEARTGGRSVSAPVSAPVSTPVSAPVSAIDAPGRHTVPGGKTTLSPQGKRRRKK